MKKPSSRLAVGCVCAAGAVALIPALAQAQLRVVSWNVTNYSSGVPSSRDGDFKTCIYGVVPNGLILQGQSMSPDVFVGQEFLSQAAVTNFLSVLNTAPGSPGDWAAAPFLDGPDTDSAFFYRTTKVDYVGTTTIALGSSSTANQPRDTRRFDIRPKGYTSAAATLALYSVHMKAQGGTNSAGRRLIEATNIRNNAEGQDTNGPGTGLPAGYQFMVCGDMNAQSSSEPFYVEYTASQTNNLGRFFDPINTPGSWNNNGVYRFIHTQDPATQVDDRHDQILICASLFDGAGLDYIGNPSLAWDLTKFVDPNHSYMCWGNDGSSFNAVLTTTGNVMVGPTIAQALVNSAAGLGHLPVQLDLRVPARVSAPVSVSFGQVQLNSTAQQNLSIGNGGDVALFNAAGIDTLGYALSASAGFSAPAGPFTDAPGGPLNSHSVSMDTSSVGIKTGTLTIASNDPDNPVLVVNLSGEVIAPPPACPADINGDHAVNTADLLILLGSFGQAVTPGTSGDIDSNGVVNTSDLLILLGAFGTNC